MTEHQKIEHWVSGHDYSNPNSDHSSDWTKTGFSSKDEAVEFARECIDDPEEDNREVRIIKMDVSSVPFKEIGDAEYLTGQLPWKGLE